MSLPPVRRRSASPRALAVSLVGVLVASLLSMIAPAAAQAAELPSSILEGGFIISDAEYFDSDSMTAAQIQTFLNARVPTCKATTGPTCLKSFTTALPKKAADKYCKEVAAKAKATAADVIAAVARACGINPKVILVILQKEQGLVASTAPSDWSYRAAMGQSCPDTSPCDAAAAGFVNQVYLGTRQQQVYTMNPTSFNYRAGQVNTIKWHPTASCGTSKVYIQNQATANLYIYTPYRPNVAALAAGYGTGDSCSTYGNRNFYNYYVDWFAPTASSSTGAPAQVGACTAPPAADIAAATGTATATAPVTARSAPTTLCGTGSAALAKGAKLTVTGAYGSWIRGTSGGKTYWAPKSSLSVSVPAPAASGDVCALPSTASITPASGTVIVTTGTLNARKAPSTSCEIGKKQLTMGSVAPRTGTYGEWWRITLGGAPYWVHSAYVEVQKPTPTPTPTPTPVVTAPTVSGTPTAGQILTASVAAWSPQPNSLTYQWKRDGVALAAGTGPTYRVTNDDAGTKLTVTASGQVTGRGAVSMTSAALSAKGFATARLAGDDRYATGVEVSKKAYPAGAKTVYLVTGGDYADALASAPLAAVKKAALLMTGKTTLPAVVAAELTRLAPSKVVLVGGEGVLDAKMPARLKSLLGSSVVVERIGGVDRYDTARKIAAAWGSAPTVYLATGRDYADALGAAAIAGAKNAPVVLVNGAASALPAASTALLKTLKTTSTVIVGGEGAVSKGIAQNLAAAKLTVTRHGGADRYATNAALNGASFSAVKSIVVATGVDFPDALTGSVLAAAASAPIFISPRTCASGAMADFLLNKGGTALTLVGGMGVLWNEVGRLQRC